MSAGKEPDMNKLSRRILSLLMLLVLVAQPFTGSAGASDEPIDVAASPAEDAASFPETELEADILDVLDAAPDVTVETVSAEEDALVTLDVLPTYAFEQSCECDGVTVTVRAEKGAFPDDAALVAQTVSDEERLDVEAAVEAEGGGGDEAVSHTFDIKLLDADGAELQPVEGKIVLVSFTTDRIAHPGCETNVYHVTGEDGSLRAEALEVETDGDTATVVTDGFSYYTVEFVYGGLCYVLEGGEEVELASILRTLGIEGTIEAVEVSDESLFYAALRDGVWYVGSEQAFSTVEWMRVTVDGVEYEITVTDDQVTNAYGTTFDVDGVVQGDNGLTFASGAQLTTIHLDYDIIGNVKNSYYTILSDDPGFTTLDATELYYDENSKGAAGDKGGTFVVYDNTISGVTISKNQDNYWDGELFSFTYPNAAVLSDGSYADLVLTYSNLHIVVQNNIKTTYSGVTYIASGDLLRAGNDLARPGTYNTRNGLQVDINIRVVDKYGNTVEGTFLYGMTDIDVDRTTVSSFGKLYDASANNYYSEAISVDSNWLDNIYIPDAEGLDESLVSYGYVGKTGYGCKVESYGDNGVRFTGLGKNDCDPGTYYSGFVTVADNTNGGINITAWTAGSKTAPVRTNLLNGDQIISHSIESSTTPGGNIQTTSSGNPYGALSDGTVLGPGNYFVPDGKDMYYTMTPYAGYTIEEIQIGDETDGSLNNVTISTEELTALRNGTVSEITVDMNDGIVERNKEVESRTGTLTYDADSNTYIFLFPENNYNHRIHVSWTPTTQDLLVTKYVIGAADDSEFTFALTLTQGSEYELPDTLNYITGEGETGTVSTTGDITFTLGADETITFLGVPLGTGYTVTETDIPDGWLFYSDDNTPGVISAGNASAYTVSYSDATTDQKNALVWADGDVRYNAGSAIPLSAVTQISDGTYITYGSASISQRTNTASVWYEDGVYYYYDNTYTPNSATADVPCTRASVTNAVEESLTVTKTVTGNMGDKTASWSFTVTVPALAGKTVAVGEDASLTFDSDGIAQFTLTHGESIVIEGIPYGSTYTVTEEEAELYTQYYEIDGEPVVARSTGERVIKEDTEVDFTNDLTLPPPTGLDVDLRPVLLLLALAGAAAIVIMPRRRAEMDEPR